MRSDAEPGRLFLLFSFFLFSFLYASLSFLSSLSYIAYVLGRCIDLMSCVVTQLMWDFPLHKVRWKPPKFRPVIRYLQEHKIRFKLRS